MDNQAKKNIANFLFEVGMLAKTPRSWGAFLGSGQQSVAEHLNRTAYIGFVLASISKNPVQIDTVIRMCLFHDISETRISDLNYIHQKYTERKEDKALEDLVATIPFGPSIKATLDEYHDRSTLEAKFAKDADNLEFLLSLKEQIDVGNERAKTWIPPLLKRLITEEAKELAASIVETDSDAWWFTDKNDEWWVSRNLKK